MRKSSFLQRMVSVITLLAFVSYLAGCSSIVNVPRDEVAELAREDSVKTGSTGLRTSRIVAATLHSGEVINFDHWGASLNTTSRTVNGVADDGTPVELKYDDVYYLKVEGADSTIKNLGPGILERTEKAQSQEKIVAVVLNSGGVINFDKHGGRFDARRRIVTGISRDGSPVSIEYDEIASIRTKRISAAKIARNFAIVGLVAIALLLLVGLAMEDDLDLGEGGFFPPDDE
jgi:hypothetical protein